MSSAEDNAAQIDRALDLLAGGHRENGCRTWGSFWAQVRQVGDLFKALHPLDPQRREDLWSRFQSICDEARRESNEERAAEEANAQRVEGAIDDLLIMRQERRMREFWDEAKHIAGLLGALRPLGRDNRGRLRKRLDDACEEVRTDSERRQAESRVQASMIWDTMDEAEAIVIANSDAGRFDRARAELADARQRMDAANLIPADRNRVWTKYQNVSSSIRSKLEFEHRVNRDIALKGAWSAYEKAMYGEDPWEALGAIKEAQAQARVLDMIKVHREEVRGVLQNAWDLAQQRIDEMKQAKRKRHEEWRDRMEDNIERWTEQRDNCRGIVTKIEREIDELEAKRADAWSDEFRDRADGWISEKHAKIESFERRIEELNAKIASVRQKLQE